MKYVFILGAGASKEAGGPLMADFLDRAALLRRSNTEGVRAVVGAFDDVFTAMSELRGVFDKSYLNLDNIEVLFGAIEMGQLLGKFADRDETSIHKLRDSLVTLIVNTLERSIPFPVRDRRIQPPTPYDNFSNLLWDIRNRSAQIHNDDSWFSFISFNYDLSLDYSLSFRGVPFDYCLDDNPSNRGLAYLKLHGSINWGACNRCNKIIPFNVGDAHFDLWTDTPHVYFNLGSKLNTRPHCDQALDGTPVIVPPTWDKTTYHSQLRSVWQQASKVLALAENIFVIGYSLPESDLFFRYLFALGSESQTRIKRFWVIDPDPQGEVERRFRSLIGRGIENRVRFFRQTFRDAVDGTALKQALEEP